MRFVLGKWAAKTVVGGCVFVGALSGGQPVWAQSTVPTVRYTREAGARQLIFVNNPEKLVLRYKETTTSPTLGTTFDDLADTGQGQKAIFQMTLGAGSYRDNFEHVYRGYLDSADLTALGTAPPANYAIHLYNPNDAPILVTLVGKGFRPGTEGGRPLAEMLNAEQPGNAAYVAPVTYRIAAKRTLWLMRTDIDYGGARPLPQSSSGTFFSGAVDFDVTGGPFVITHLAYQNFRSITSWSDTGFVTRTNAGSAAPESRVYKGLMMHPTEETSPGTVVTNLTFTVGPDTAAGTELPVSYPQFVNIGGGNYAASPTAAINANFWVTHNIPSRRTDSVSDDMFDTEMPGFGTVFALRPVVAVNTPFVQANIANWGITYHQAVTVVNNDTRNRTFALTLNNFATSGSNITYLNNAGSWVYTRLQGTGTGSNAPLPYRTFTVPAGSSSKIDGYFILGSPSVGTMRQAVQVTN